MPNKLEYMIFTDYDSYIDIIQWMKECNDTFANASEIIYSGKYITLQTTRGPQIAKQHHLVCRDEDGNFFTCAPF